MFLVRNPNEFDGQFATRHLLMKVITGLALTRGRMVRRGAMVYCVSLLLLAVFCSIGCHKAGDTTAVPPAPVAAAPDTNQADQTAAVDTQSHAPVPTPLVADPNAPPLVKPNGDPDLRALDHAMLRWVMANQRAPASFAEFAATAGVAIPPPPPGKKYAFSQTMHVILVNQ
jgi:hypothetical protein